MDSNKIILSFDVGIVNLSYCLVTKNNNNWCILEWGIINITEKPKYLCSCGKVALYNNIVNNKIIYYCKKHIDKSDINFSDFYTENTDIELKCCHKIKLHNNICNKIGKFISKNNECYCKIHAFQYYNNINKLNTIKKIKHIQDNYNDIIYKLIQELENKPTLLNCDYVVIENQPSFKNPKMKSIATTIYNYYLLRGIFDKNKTKSNIKEVKFLSPSNKLKIINNEDYKQLNECKNTTKSYKITKQLGIKYCLENIKFDKQWTDFFNNNKKKDDLADSFLQGIYFYNNI